MMQAVYFLSLLFVISVQNASSQNDFLTSSALDEYSKVEKQTKNLRSYRNSPSLSRGYGDEGIFVTSDSDLDEGTDFIVPSGVSFSRKIKKIPDDVYLFEELEGTHCKITDNYGSNECSFKWGDSISGQVKFEQAITIDETQYIEGIFKLKKVIDWSFSCAACGKPCVVSVPVINKDFSFPVPNCPFAPKKGTSMITKSFDFKLPKNSPINGVKLPLEGNIYLKSKVDDSILAEIFVDIIVK